MAETGARSQQPTDNQNPVLSSASSTKNDSVPEEFALGRRGILVFSTLSILALMAALDGTSLSVALQKLKGTAIEAFWSGTAFLLSSTVFQPSFASFSNIFGRRPLVLTAILLFFVGTVVAAVSKNFTYMLVGRSIQGVGGGGILALSEVIVTDLVPLRLRGQYFGIFSLAEKLRRIDYVGTTLFVGSISSFLIPLTWGGVLYDWDSWRTLVPLIIGAVGLIVFGLYEYFIAADPIIPPKIFQNRTATVTFIGSLLQGLVLWCVLYYLPLYYQAVKEYSPILSGVALFPESLTVAPSAMVVGFLCTKFGRYRWAIWAGWALSTLGLGLICLIKPDSSVPAWIFLNLVPGLGLGFLFPSLGFAVQASATNDNLAIAVAMFSFFRALGQAVGVAIGGVVFQNRMYANLLKYPTLAPMADPYSQDAAGLVQIIKATPWGIEKMQLKEAYTDSLRIVWAVCCAVSGVAFLLSFWTERYDLNQALESKQGLRSETIPDEEGLK